MYSHIHYVQAKVSLFTLGYLIQRMVLSVDDAAMTVLHDNMRSTDAHICQYVRLWLSTCSQCQSVDGQIGTNDNDGNQQYFIDIEWSPIMSFGYCGSRGVTDWIVHCTKHSWQ